MVHLLFYHTNGYHNAVIQNIFSKVKEEQSTPFVHITGSHQGDVSKSYLRTLSYKGKRGGKQFVALPKR